MKTLTTILTATLLIALTTACSDRETPDSKRFDWDLRGTWVSNDPSVYSGMLIIDYDKITILGYEEGQTPPFGDDTRRPFRNFTKDVALTGYSDSLYIFIVDAGELQNGIPYNYYTQNYGRDKFLRFMFGGRNETLRWVE